MYFCIGFAELSPTDGDVGFTESLLGDGDVGFAESLLGDGDVGFAEPLLGDGESAPPPPPQALRNAEKINMNIAFGMGISRSVLCKLAGC